MPHEIFNGEPEFYSEGTPVIIVKKGAGTLLEPEYWKEGTAELAVAGEDEFNALLVMINN